jgi:hypothetical protein
MLRRNLPQGVQEVEHGGFPSVRPRDSSMDRSPSQIPGLILAEKRRNSFCTYRLFLSGDSGLPQESKESMTPLPGGAGKHPVRLFTGVPNRRKATQKNAAILLSLCDG